VSRRLDIDEYARRRLDERALPSVAESEEEDDELTLLA